MKETLSPMTNFLSFFYQISKKHPNMENPKIASSNFNQKYAHPLNSEPVDMGHL